MITISIQKNPTFVVLMMHLEVIGRNKSI
nr:RNA polymerase beta' subunit [Helleborus thibetanus]